MRKSDLPVGSVVVIGARLAVKFQFDTDEGRNWRWVDSGEVVEYDTVYKATWDLPNSLSIDQHGGALKRAEDFVSATTDAERLEVLTRGLPTVRDSSRGGKPQ